MVFGMFGDEVVDVVYVVFVVWVLVLYCGIFDFGVFQCYQFDDCGVQLVFIVNWCGVVFQVGYVCFVFVDDQGVFELVGVVGVDVEIGVQFYWVVYVFGDEYEVVVGEYC